jgi:hypothetical protein
VIAAVIIALLFLRKWQLSRNAAVPSSQLSHPGFETRTAPFDPVLDLYGSRPHLPSSIEYVQPLTYATPSRSSGPTSDYSNDRRTNSYQPSVSSGRTHTSASGLVPRGINVRASNAPSTDLQMSAASSPETRELSYNAESYATESNHPEAHLTRSSSSPPSSMSPPPAFSRNSELTEEQALYLNTLYLNNMRRSSVPPSEIARWTEGGLGIGGSHIRPILEESAPPGYDFKSPH